MHGQHDPLPVRLLRGEMDGIPARLLSLALCPASWLFASVAEARRAMYESGLLTRHRVPTPVISIGNLTVGGTGKTPLVEWVVREIRLLGVLPVVLSRGYGAAPGEAPDELTALSENFADLAFVRDGDRVRGALKAIELHAAGAIVLDDGFQHLRLARDLDLVTVDATSPFGGGHCLPRGGLREPVRNLRRAQGVVVTRADLVPRRDLEKLVSRVHRVAPAAALATATHRPVCLETIPRGEEHGLRELQNVKVFAVSGVGNPGAFEETLRRLGARIVGKHRYRDHYRYRSEDMASIGREATGVRAEAVVTTQKDAVKWEEGGPAGIPSFALLVSLSLSSGAGDIRRLLRTALRGASTAG